MAKWLHKVAGKQLKPRILLLIALAIIFLSELIVTNVLGLLPTYSSIYNFTLNALLLCLIALPLLYAFLYRPIKKSIYENMHYENEILRNSIYDKCTGLPNRILFEDRLKQHTLLAERENSNYALIVIKIHHLVEINDAIGYENANEMLKILALRLRYALRMSDTLSRISGKSFALLLPMNDINDVYLVIDKLKAVTGKSISVHDVPITLESSFGVTLYPKHGKEPLKLLQKAELALTEASKSIHGYAIYEAMNAPENKRRLVLFTHLKEAIDKKTEISLFYQPKVEISSGQIVAIEALARWNHTEIGFIPPNEFIPLAEHTGLIRPFSNLIIETAFADLTKLKQRGIDMNMSINLSSRDIQDLTLSRQIAELLKRTELDTQYIEFEITESAFMNDSKRAIKCAEELSKMGFSLSLDDYGKDYSSLIYLSKLPVSKLKIDMEFIQKLVDSPKNIQIVKSTISMAHNLGIKVVAEGVEDFKTEALLKQFGCDMGQGYYYSKPLAFEEYCEFHHANQLLSCK
ncbi:MAG: bifunctional diguanylate cyclase/phosphodiesterase [Kangiellaceae bacterium]|nr:bifunctional diguanylate cyclase/phosphodiesterase [Kangiellaceae bacterium]